jgi:hypothetical protein
MASGEPSICCACCRHWLVRYEPSDYVYEQAADVPVCNSGTRGWCAEGKRVNRDDLEGTFYEHPATGLQTDHDCCCPLWKARG